LSDTGEESLPPLEEASISVDALVSETTTEITDRPATGAGIVGFKAFAPPSLFSAPPGLSLPHAHPPPAVVADMSSESKLQPQPLAAASNTSNPAVVPAIPMLPITPAQLATPLKKDLRSAQSPMPQQTTSSPSKSSILDSKLPSDLSQTATKSVFASTGSPKREAMAGTTISLSSPVKVLMRKTSKIQDRETAASTADVKSETTQVDAHSQDSLGIQQRQHPGKLDISAATDASTKSQTVPASSSSKALETSTKNIHSAPPAISSGPRLEASISQTSGSPSSRQSQPRTIRVLPTAKTEIQPPPPASALLPAVASPVAVTKIPSRQPSLASINRPATPISELISDNASMTSTSVSRANSPPPTKVGIAPVRQVTKSQQKKERQARAKMVEESKKSEETVEKAAPEEPEQAPIIGRKKKAKKPTTTDATASSTPAPSRPGSPAAKESENVAPELEKPVPLTPAKESRKEIKKDVSKAQEKKTSEVSVAPQTSTVNDPSQRTSLTAASIIADLQASGDINPATLEFFKNVPGINYRHEISSADFRDLDRKIVISDDERVMLSQGHPVHLAPSSDKTSSRMMISPAGAFLRGLTPEQEQRFVELEKRTMSATGPAKFNPGRHGNEVGARAFQTYQEVATNGILHQKAAADPAANKKLDEALNYVNQFIDPTSLPDGGSQKSKTGYEVDDFGLNYKSAREQQWLRKPLMTVEEAEAAIQVARKETEALEKRLNGLLKRNKRFVFGGAH